MIVPSKNSLPARNAKLFAAMGASLENSCSAMSPIEVDSTALWREASSSTCSGSA